MDSHGNGEPVKAPPKAGQSFMLSRLEKLDSKAAMAKFELDHERLEQAKLSYLAQLAGKVLERAGVSAREARVLSLQYRHDPADGSVVSIEVLPEPDIAPDDELAMRRAQLAEFDRRKALKPARDGNVAASGAAP